MSDSNSNHTQGRRTEIWAVIAMAVPGVVTNSARALIDFSDFVMVKWLNSDEAQAAILSAQMVFWTYTVLGNGIVMMVNTFASQSLGRKRPRDCSAYAWQSLYVSAIIGGAAFLFRPFLPQLFALFGHDPEVQALERVYADIAVWMVAPTVASYALSSFFTGIHRPKVAMWSVVESCVLNVVLAWGLMFGHFGFEPMGLAGTAWATVIALTYRAVRLGAAMFTPFMRREFGTAETWHPSWAKVKDILRAGIPCGLTYFSEIMVWALFVNVLVGKFFGTADLIATSSAWQYLRVSFLPAVGVGQALTALVGRSIGAGDLDKARRETRIAVWLTTVYMGVLSIVYAVAGGPLIAWFNADPAIVSVGAKVMICAAVFQLADAFSITYVCALRGAGDTVVPAVFFVISQWAMIIGGGWWVAVNVPSIGSLGPWIAASTLIIVTALFLWWRWHMGAWMKIDLFKSRRGE